jgi:hypothetical protein
MGQLRQPLVGVDLFFRCHVWSGRRRRRRCRRRIRRSTRRRQKLRSRRSAPDQRRPFVGVEVFGNGGDERSGSRNFVVSGFIVDADHPLDDPAELQVLVVGVLGRVGVVEIPRETPVTFFYVSNLQVELTG